jgi:DNA mismatch endonuclease (patch repair protein)
MASVRQRDTGPELWHVHKGCKFSTKPSTRRTFWNEKFETNQKRDQRNYQNLLKNGWRVLVVWECAIKKKNEEELKIMKNEILKWFHSTEKYFEIGNVPFGRPICE